MVKAVSWLASLSPLDGLFTSVFYLPLANASGSGDLPPIVWPLLGLLASPEYSEAISVWPP
jgi:hypothetical protein